MMNADKLTQKSMEALQEANDTAVRYRAASIGQLHLLYALLAQDGGFIPQVFKKMTVEPADLLSAVRANLETAYSSTWWNIAEIIFVAANAIFLPHFI